MPTRRINGFLRALALAVCGLALAACAAPPSGVVVYSASEIDNRQIHFIWLELPEDLVLGSNDVRILIARTDPPGLLVPTEIELPCTIQDNDDYLEFRPLTLGFEFDGTQLEGSYTWSACASCVECYMNWDTTLEIVGTPGERMMALSIGIRHMGHNIQDDFLRLELLQESPTSREPGIRCRGVADCLEVEYLPRQ